MNFKTFIFFIFLVLFLWINIRIPFVYSAKKVIKKDEFRTKILEKDLKKLIKKWHLIIEKKLHYKYKPLSFDPFEPIKKKVLKPAPISKKATIYFKEYSINELKLVGIVKIDNQYIAVIEDPLSRAFFLRKGDYIGKELGVIAKITDGEVYISQRYIDYKGNIVLDKKAKVLRLRGEDNV